MRQRVLLLVIGSVFAMSAWAGNGASKQEGAGVGSGAAIGAMAGGPIGLILGATLGGWLGDRFHHEHGERVAFEQRFQEAQADAEALEASLVGSEREVARLGSALGAEQRAHRDDVQQAVNIEIYFRTAESELSPGVEQRLAQLAQVIGPIDGTLIRLDGYADARGEETYNEQLSAERAAAVRDALVRAGLAENRIVMSAEGERGSTADVKDLDALALERRVQLKIVEHGSADRVARE